mgnify:CR=1 FL=1
MYGCFFFQAEDGIRDLVRSRGLGDVYKRQPQEQDHLGEESIGFISFLESAGVLPPPMREMVIDLSLIHI